MISPETDAQEPGRSPSFEAALKSDAARIRAEASPALDRRIEAALAGVRQVPATPARRETFVRPWLTGSLVGVGVGVGVAAAVVLLIGRTPEVPAPTGPAAYVAETPSEQLRAFREQLPLNVETAELTAPLEEELRNLQSDFEKARRNVERDLGLSF